MVTEKDVGKRVRVLWDGSQSQRYHIEDTVGLVQSMSEPEAHMGKLLTIYDHGTRCKVSFNTDQQHPYWCWPTDMVVLQTQSIEDLFQEEGD